MSTELNFLHIFSQVGLQYKKRLRKKPKKSNVGQ